MPITRKEISFPFISSFADYHEIDIELDILKRFYEGIDGCEAGFVAPHYIGLFYEKGNKPSRPVVLNMIKEHTGQDNLTYDEHNQIQDSNY